MKNDDRLSDPLILLSPIDRTLNQKETSLKICPKITLQRRRVLTKSLFSVLPMREDELTEEGQYHIVTGYHMLI